LTKSLYPVSPDRLLVSHQRRLTRLERRGAGPWHYVGETGEPPFLNSWANTGGGWIPTRFRVLQGGGVEVHMNVTGGVLGDPVWTMPAGYFDPDGDIPLHAFDESGNFVPGKIQSNGDVVQTV
jgi:hypothetical protein